MIIVVSDFSVQGSGYQRIMTRLCKRLVLDHEIGVVALGLGYNGEEHHWPFSIVPTPHVSHIPHMINRLRSYNAPIEAVVVGFDIPLQEGLVQALDIPGDIPYIGIFPLEAEPLCQPWAIQLLRMDARLIMTRFGQAELERAGVDSEIIEIGVDLDLWQPPNPEQRAIIRQGLNIDDDAFMVLTVADNQERKNLSRAAEIISQFSVDITGYAPNGFVTAKEEKRKTAWYLVTRMDSPVGWKLDDLAMRTGIMDRVAFFNRGVPDQKLWMLYAAADAFLLTSKAEGLAMPVLEAMACGVPVAGTACTAIQEHLQDGRGWLIEPEYQYMDPFGNGNRYWASVTKGAEALEEIQSTRGTPAYEAKVKAAREYVESRTWDKAAALLAETVRRVATEKGTLIDGQAKTTAPALEIAPA